MAYLAGLLVWWSLASAAWSWKRALKDGDVILGGLFDVNSDSETLTDCEKIFPASLGLAEAMVYAVEKVNSDAKLLPNVTLGYDIRDYCYRSELAMEITYDFVRAGDPKCQQQGNAWQGFISKPVVAVVGPPDSQSSLMVTTLFGVRNIPVLSPVATSAELSTSLYDNFYRTIPSDKWQTIVMADIVEYFNWTYVGLVALDDSYGRNAVSALQEEASSRGTFCLAFTEIIPRLDYLTEIERVVKRVKESRKAKVVLVWLYGSFGKNFFQEVSKQEISGYTWILSEGVVYATGDIFNDPGFNVLDGSLAIQPHGYFDKGFERHLRGINRHKLLQENQLPWWDEFWRLEFNCSIKGGPLQTSGCPFNLSSTRSIRQLNSGYIPYCLDAVYALAHAVDKMYRDEGKSAKATFSVKEQDLGQYLKLVNFDGLTGNVRFDRFGDPVEATYGIINIRKATENPGDPHVVWVGSWNKSQNQSLRLGNARIRWNPNVDMVSSLPSSVCSEPCLPGTRKSVSKPRCCWECVRCPDGTMSSQVGSTSCTECGKQERSNAERSKCEPLPLMSATLSSPSGLTVVVVSVCGLFLTLWFGLLMIKYYQSPVVKGSNRELSFLLLVAITAKIANAMLYIQKPSDLWCRISLPCRYLLCNVCVSILLLKTLRLLIIFQNIVPPIQFQRWLLDSRKQGIAVCLLQVVVVVLMVLWLCTDPPHEAALVSPGSHISLVCRRFSSWSGLALVISIGVYLITLCIICTVYAFKARRIPENFNEAKYIGFSMYIISMTTLLSEPLEFAMEGWYVTLVSSAATLINAFGLLGCMFGPKVYVILAHPEQNTEEAVRTQVAHYSFQSSQLAGNRVGAAPPVS